VAKVWNSNEGLNSKDDLDVNFKTRLQWQQVIPQMNQLKGTTKRKSSAAQVSTCKFAIWYVWNITYKNQTKTSGQTQLIVDVENVI
jgi:hypothetical protein